MLFHQQLINKIIDKEAALRLISTIQSAGKKIVFTNGCFDIVHPGHVDYLCQARDAGDFLILGLNTDASVKSLNKAPNRPINNEFARAKVLAGLACVDCIVLFNEATPLELISFLNPNILVKGNDYTIEQIVGHDVVIKNGGSVITIPLLEGYSTSNIIAKILS
ncbi:MAG: D-glycero-beta-D-manno-heptose 1-phosphate adenylyltransferase [Bacteroidota bacterium]